MSELPEADARPEVAEQPAEPKPLFEFEGAYVTDMEAILPRLVMAMEEGYTRGTHMDLKVEVRVRNVRYDEQRDGTMKRVHALAIEDVQVLRAYNPDQVPDTTTLGSASAGALTEEERAEVNEAVAGPAVVEEHVCAECPDCIHDGKECCGCYDGFCCRDPQSGHGSAQDATGDPQAVGF